MSKQGKLCGHEWHICFICAPSHFIFLEDAWMSMKTEASTLPLWKRQRTEGGGGSKNWFGKVGWILRQLIKSVHYSLSEFEYQYYLDNTHFKSCLEWICSFYILYKLFKNLFSYSRNCNFTLVLGFQQYFNLKMIT